ncbi:MAG TPA: AAA family ATPase [Opitutaceae bacterium]|nr:AAA family ATPase [Opitutaceae bacterium]
MNPTPYSDLPSLAADLRKELDAKRFILIYAYNGTGKTRLSTEFKRLGKKINAEGETIDRDTLYFNAFTEDLFNWDNDLQNDKRRVLKLNEKSHFFDGLATMEMDTRIRPLLDRYCNFDFRIDSEIDKDGKLTKAEVIFFPKIEEGNDKGGDEDSIKISRGEENIFIWCFFLAILQLTLDGAKDYEWVKYVYIDDPISSLDEHNAIVVGNHLVQLYREAKRHVRTVVSTHHALFFNVLHYEIKNHIGKASQYMLKRDRHSAPEIYVLEEQKGDTPQFYHVSALSELWEFAIEEKISTYHFNVLRSILEKTAFFHGYGHFSSCLKRDPQDAEGILHQRFVDILSHGKYSMYEPVEMQEQTRDYFRQILRGFLDRHPFNPQLFSHAVAPSTFPVAAPTGSPVATVNNPAS